MNPLKSRLLSTTVVPIVVVAAGVAAADMLDRAIPNANAAAKAKPVQVAACNPCAAKKCNPCAAKKCNPCAAKACNPCAAKACNPCAAKACNPCAAKKCNPCNPCAAKRCNPCNPCGANACNPCNPCNPCGASAANFSAKCVIPRLQTASACNPCNPCAAKRCNPCNPCAAKACNPCAAKKCNPCAAKACNPCAAKKCNPCAAKACNPCNPCAAKRCNPCNPCAANACNPCNPCNPCGGAAAPEITKAEALAAYDCLMNEMQAAYAKSGNAFAAQFVKWRLYNNRPYVSDTHGGRLTNNYANAAAGNYGKFEKLGKFSKGAVLAKDSFTVNKAGRIGVGPLFLMEKMSAGFNKASGDWKYTLIMPNGQTVGVTGGKGSKAVGFCHECHIAVAEDQDSAMLLPEEFRK